MSAQLEQRERRWILASFWCLYCLGPVMAVIPYATTRLLVGALPSQLGLWLGRQHDLFGVWAPVLGSAMGAGYCLSRLYNPRSKEETLGFIIVGGTAVAMSYFAVLGVGCVLLSLVTALARGLLAR